MLGKRGFGDLIAAGVVVEPLLGDAQGYPSQPLSKPLRSSSELMVRRVKT